MEASAGDPDRHPPLSSSLRSGTLLGKDRGSPARSQHSARHAGAGPPGVEGRYEVEREIGKGGNARIFLAREPGGQPVALKILHPELLVSVAADRFLREIKLASQLNHPHIARICWTPVSATGSCTTS